MRQRLAQAIKRLLDRPGLRWILTALRACWRPVQAAVVRIDAAASRPGVFVPLNVWWALLHRNGIANSELQVLLDRPGVRWLFAWVVASTEASRRLGVKRVLRRDGAWIREFADGFVFAGDFDSAGPTPAGLDAQTSDVWEYAYTPQAGDTVVDIGAGTGTEALRWSRLVGPTGRVVAVEAQPTTFKRMRVFCELNRLQNVDLLNLALSDAPGTVMIEGDDIGDYRWASIKTDRGAVPVRSVTLDGLLEELRIERVDFLKMNIEGAETAAIAGLVLRVSSVLRMNVSCHDFRAEWGHGEQFRTKQHVESLLREKGYRVEPHPDHPDPWMRDQLNAIAASVASPQDSARLAYPSTEDRT